MGKHSEDSVVIKSDKVYASYFSRACKILPDSMIVSIALTSPEGFKGKFYRDLNPTSHLFNGYKYNNMSAEEYTKTYYYDVLRDLDPNIVYNNLKGKVICCWEKSGEFCHRNIVMKWLQENIGEDIIGGEI